ncbi:MobC family plasmid mobilization relaxosome protein [Streptomyces sp. NPDC004667]|uniref:MobC family plasmid mobilization relaxosome protein n=1 Tax=Streptomyces sp. NPDC004667 TaxID=3154285 RepID=UPI00339E6072
MATGRRLRSPGSCHLDGCRSPNPWGTPPTPGVQELFAARRRLGQIGNNLNQLTRAVNSGGRPTDIQLDAVLDSIHQASTRVQDATDQLISDC